MSTFGKKHRKEWNADDNASHAMAAMLGAELRQKTDAHNVQRSRMYAALTGLAIAGVYLVAHFAFGW